MWQKHAIVWMVVVFGCAWLAVCGAMSASVELFGVLAGRQVYSEGPVSVCGDIGVGGATRFASGEVIPALVGFGQGQVASFTGKIFVNDTDAIDALADAASVYNELMSKTCTDTISGDLAGLTLGPGTYCVAANTDMLLDGLLILDPGSDNTATWTFLAPGGTMGGNIIFGQDAAVVGYSNVDVDCDSVNWIPKANAVVHIGASVVGNIYTSSGHSIEVEARASVSGQVVAIGGLIELNNAATINLCRCSESASQEGEEVTIDDGLSVFGVLAATLASADVLASVCGNVGVSPGVNIVGFTEESVSGDIQNDTAAASEAQAEAALLYDELAAIQCTTDLEDYVEGQVLAPGTYCVLSDEGNGGTLELLGRLTLDMGNQSDGMWVFIAFAIEVADNISVVIVNAPDDQSAEFAVCNNVFWLANTTVTIGQFAKLLGSVYAVDGVYVGSGATVSGRVVSLDDEVVLAGTSTVGTCFCGSGSSVAVSHVSEQPGATNSTLVAELNAALWVIGVLMVITLSMCVSGPARRRWRICCRRTCCRLRCCRCACRRCYKSCCKRTRSLNRQRTIVPSRLVLDNPALNRAPYLYVPPIQTNPVTKRFESANVLLQTRATIGEKIGEGSFLTFDGGVGKAPYFTELLDDVHLPRQLWQFIPRSEPYGAAKSSTSDYFLYNPNSRLVLWRNTSFDETFGSNEPLSWCSTRMAIGEGHDNNSYVNFSLNSEQMSSSSNGNTKYRYGSDIRYYEKPTPIVGYIVPSWVADQSSTHWYTTHGLPPPTDT